MDRRTFIFSQGMLVPLFTVLFFLSFMFISIPGTVVIVDNTPPSAEIERPGGVVPASREQVNLLIEVKEAHFQSIDVSIDGSSVDVSLANQTGTLMYFTGNWSVGEEGPHSMEVDVEDQASQRGEASKTFSVTATDTCGQWLNPEEGDWVSNTVELKVNVTPSGPVDSVKFAVDENKVDEFTQEDGVWTLEWDSSTVEKGGHVLKAKVVENDADEYVLSIFVGVEEPKRVIPINELLFSLGLGLVVATPCSVFIANKYKWKKIKERIR